MCVYVCVPTRVRACVHVHSCFVIPNGFISISSAQWFPFLTSLPVVDEFCSQDVDFWVLSLYGFSMSFFGWEAIHLSVWLVDSLGSPVLHLCCLCLRPYRLLVNSLGVMWVLILYYLFRRRHRCGESLGGEIILPNIFLKVFFFLSL